jgi:hypothetical protein
MDETILLKVTTIVVAFVLAVGLVILIHGLVLGVAEPTPRPNEQPPSSNFFLKKMM